MTLTIHLGAGVRTCEFNGATYDLNALDRTSFNVLRKSISSKFRKSKGGKKR